MRPVILLSLLLVSSSVFASDLASRSDAIIKGDACPAETHPATVAVLVDGEVTVLGLPQMIKTVTCTGTLIAPDVVMTAAHCVDMSMYSMGGIAIVRGQAYAVSLEPDLVSLSEQTTTDFPPDTVSASKWVVHPKYALKSLREVDGPGDHHDIALLFLKKPITHVQPALVITAEEAAQLRVGSEVEISGWGMTTADGSAPKGSVGKKVCATSFVAELGATEMQVGLGADSSRKCHGDSGGPTYLDVDTPHDVKRRVVGITSHAYDARDCSFGGVDTRVDAYLPWIEAELVKGCEKRRRSWCGVRGLISPELLDDGKTLPFDDGSGGDGGGCGCAGEPSGLAALAAALLARRRPRPVTRVEHQRH